MKKETIPYYTVAAPYDVVYRNCSTKFPVGPHTHNAAELYFTLSDLPDVLLDNRISQVPTGSLIVVPPFCIHQMYHMADLVYERYILTVDPKWLEAIFFDNRDLFAYLKYGETPSVIPLNEKNTELLKKRFDQFLRHKDAQNLKTLADFWNLLEQVDLCVKATAPDKNPKTLRISESQQKVNDMIQYIHENLHDSISLQRLSDHFYLNPDYLSRLFKKHTHISVGHYIAIEKITCAQSLLKEGLTVTQVQESLNYSDYAHFAKTFKKLTGETPGQYRAKNRG